MGCIWEWTDWRYNRVHQGSICHKVDLVLFKDGSGAGFKVGKVKLHFEVHGLAFSIISKCAINKHDPHSGYSVWTPLNQNICIEAAQILDTLVYSELPDDTIAALLPLHWRMHWCSWCSSSLQVIFAGIAFFCIASVAGHACLSTWAWDICFMEGKKVACSYLNWIIMHLLELWYS